MTDIEKSVAALTGLMAALSTLIPVVIKLWKKVSRQEQRITLFWRSRIMRGTVEALYKGLVSQQIADDVVDYEDMVPLAVTPFVYQTFSPIQERLKEVRKRNPDAEHIELAEIIEERFGPWMVQNICISLGVTEYACIVMALSIADGIPPVEGSKMHVPLIPVV